MKDFCIWVRSPEGQLYGTTGNEILRHGARTTVHLAGLEIEMLVIADQPSRLKRLGAGLLSAYRTVRGIH